MATTLLILALISANILSTPTQSPITVTMDSAHPDTVTPGSVALIRGVVWADHVTLGGFDGDDVLAGYAVRMNGQTCKLRNVTPDQIAAIVPDQIAPGTATIEVIGPSVAFSVSVEVVVALPRLIEQRGFVVATSAWAMFPTLYVNGDAIPVSPMTFNYLSVQAVGLPIAPAGVPVTVILDGARHYEIEGRAYPMIGFPGVSHVMWFAPVCADGDYAMMLRIGDAISSPVAIRFKGDCLVTGDGARIRRPN